MGVTLPAAVSEFYSVHNGVEGELLFGLEWLSLEQMAETWAVWKGLESMNRDAEFVADMDARPTGAIKPLYTNSGWIPLTHDVRGNHIGIDFDPAENGVVGQIIVFGRDEDIKLLAAANFTKFIEDVTRELEKRGVMADGQIAIKGKEDEHFHNRYLERNGLA